MKIADKNPLVTYVVKETNIMKKNQRYVLLISLYHIFCCFFLN